MPYRGYILEPLTRRAEGSLARSYRPDACNFTPSLKIIDAEVAGGNKEVGRPSQRWRDLQFVLSRLRKPDFYEEFLYFMPKNSGRA